MIAFSFFWNASGLMLFGGVLSAVLRVAEISFATALAGRNKNAAAALD